MKNLKSINEFWGAVIRRDMSSAVREEDKFHSKGELKDYLKKEIRKQGKNVVIRNLDVSDIEDLSYLFKGLLSGVETLDLSGWNTSGVKDIHSMFAFCDNIKSLDLSGWDTSDVENMGNLFYDCENLESLDLSGWITDEVIKMYNVFIYCINLKSLDLSGWNTDNVEDMSYMFAGCENLEDLDLSGWSTKSIKTMERMFRNCPAPYKVVDNKIVRK